MLYARLQTRNKFRSTVAQAQGERCYQEVNHEVLLLSPPDATQKYSLRCRLYTNHLDIGYLAGMARLIQHSGSIASKNVGCVTSMS